MRLATAGADPRRFHVERVKLNDKEIRAALTAMLAAQPNKPRAVIQELRVYNGNAIADVVALFEEAHCFEIKGDSDKIERLSVQGPYYNAAFRRITLVTTSSHLERALTLTPVFWGVTIASSDGGKILFRRKRSAKQNPLFCKQQALLTLWKNEMLTLLPGSKKKQHPRETLAKMISAAARKVELSNQICELLFSRHASSQAKNSQTM